ncbi:MAG: PrsW family glutamic-type intramembrane protease [bacterium]
MLLVVIAVAPGAFWLWYFLQRDRLRPEPRHLIRRVFLLGAGAALIAGALELMVFGVGGIRAEGSGLGGAVVAATIIAVIEESAKFGAIYYGVYRNVECNEVVDGIIYAVAASLGFATLENIMYVLGGGIGVGIMRAILSVPGHAFFGALMGFYIGVAKCSIAGATASLARGLILAVIAHAAYDAFLFSGTFLALAVLPLVLFLWWRAIVHTRRALAMDNERLGGAV